MSALKNRSKIDLLVNAGTSLDTVALFVDNDVRTLEKQFFNHKLQSFEVTERYKTLSFVYAQVAKQLIKKYVSTTAKAATWTTTADADERLLTLAIESAQTFFAHLYDNVSATNVSTDVDDDWIKDALKVRFEEYFSTNDALEIFAAVLAFELAQTVKSAGKAVKTLQTVSEAVSRSVRRNLYYFEDASEMKLLAKLGQQDKALNNNLIYTLKQSDLSLFALSDSLSITRNELDAHIKAHVEFLLAQ